MDYLNTYYNEQITRGINFRNCHHSKFKPLVQPRTFVRVDFKPVILQLTIILYSFRLYNTAIKRHKSRTNKVFIVVRQS